MPTVQLTFRYAALNSTLRVCCCSYAEHTALVAEMATLGWVLIATRTV